MESDWNLLPILALIGTSLVWGVTNPLMKRGSRGINQIEHGNPIAKAALEFWFLFSRLSYLIPFLLNMLGSVLFYYSLSMLDLSLVVPSANSLTFVITHIASVALGENKGHAYSPSLIAGMFCVVFGVSICMYSNGTTHE